MSDRRYYPVYQTCIDLDLPIVVNAGIAGSAGALGLPGRHAFRPGLLRLPRIAHRHAPRGRAVGGAGREADAQVAGTPLHDSAFAPKYYPKAIIDYANTRGADKIMYAGYFPMALTLERIFSELAAVPFRDHVWPKFLRENAMRVFKLDE